jgi:hypothetical protein
MKGRSLVVTVAIFVLALGGLGTLLAYLLRYESAWYRKAALPPGTERSEHSKEFKRELSSFFGSIEVEREWAAHFTDVQINSYLDEGFTQSGVGEHLLPEGINSPHVIFDPERIHLAFRYGTGLFSTLITIDLRVWVVQGEQNVVALELEGFHAGALRISAKSLLEKVSEVGRLNNIAVTWYRDRESGHPVAILQFQDDRARSTYKLNAVQLGPGSLVISGQSSDSGPNHSVLANPVLGIGPN